MNYIPPRGFETYPPDFYIWHYNAEAISVTKCSPSEEMGRNLTH